jgi:LmbE family N-acetylglucosaminyl deacetylase
LRFDRPVGPVLALGAHADDVEIAAGGFLLWLRDRFSDIEIQMAVFTGDSVRYSEAKASANELCGTNRELAWLGANDGLLPMEAPLDAKAFLREVAEERPAVVLAPCLDDAHQDHRFVSELAWQVCRGAWIIEYQIPKWDPETIETNVFVPLSDEIAEAKLDHLERHFPSQHDKPWYRRELFDASLISNGVRCGARRAEGFLSRRTVVG